MALRDFQQTVTQGISDSYVRWRGIEATLQLAQSPNTKIVIIGSGKDGLPVILGNVDTPMQPNRPAPRPRPAAATLPLQQRSGPRMPWQRRARRSWKRRRREQTRRSPAEPTRRRPGCRAGRRPGNSAPRLARKTDRPAQRQGNLVGRCARRSAHILDLVGDSGPHFTDRRCENAGAGRLSAGGNASRLGAQGQGPGPAPAATSPLQRAPTAASGGRGLPPPRRADPRVPAARPE